MLFQLKNSLTSNITLKMASFLLGLSFWILLDSYTSRTITLDVPVCFYEQQAHTHIQAPSSIEVNLRGKRNDLLSLDQHSLAVHINAQHYKVGAHKLIVDQSTLFLPSSIKLVNYSPANSMILIKEKSDTHLLTLIQNEKTQQA
jgi:hypothetical protein